MADKTVNDLAHVGTLLSSDKLYVARAPFGVGDDAHATPNDFASFYSASTSASAIAAGRPALQLLGQESGIAFDFLAQSGAIYDYTGAQTAFGRPSQLLTVARASTATFVGRNRLLQTASANTLRYAYDPTTGVPRGLLLEQAATNLCLQSSNLSASWSISNGTPTADATTAPDGTTTADLFTEDSATGVPHFPYSSGSTVTSGSQNVASIWVKRGSGARNFRLALLSTSFADGAAAVFDLAAGTVGAVSYVGTGSSGVAKITAYPDGWYRCQVSCVAGASATIVKMMAYLHDGTNHVYNGDGASGLYFWGAQIESGLTATSYIPTTTGSAQRFADSAPYILTSAFPHDATQGTLLVEWENPVQFSAAIQFGCVASLSDGTTANRICAGIQQVHPTNQPTQTNGVYVGSVAQAFTTYVAHTFGTISKAALNYRANDFGSLLDGVAQTPDTSGAVPSVTRLALGTAAAGTPPTPIYIRKVAYITRRMTDAEAATAI